MSGLHRNARLYWDATIPLYQQHMQMQQMQQNQFSVMLRSPLQENVNTSSTFLFENPPTHNSLVPSKVENGPDSPSSDAGSQDSDQTYTSEMRTLEVIARAQAMFDFLGEDCGDLPFKVSDVINIIEFINDDWWRGVLGKEVGIFPSAYVQKLNPPDKGNYPPLLIKIRKPASLHSLTEQEDSIHTIHPLVTVESREF
ncbi:hypothetical protein BGZ97_007480 [Linnemannia gamsii]|uniref:SH3 domain-containing protein n=1 Tax=Linnemannia gamsii TaxID=64522 RepID=A0A9P6URG9_9FUNG|nr:hypothetical protein BGZ97_007480 [Linnemannia gamsii]